MIDAVRTVRQWRERLRAHLQSVRATRTSRRRAEREWRVDGEKFYSHQFVYSDSIQSDGCRVFISTLTAFSLERDRENGDDNQTCRVSIEMPQMRGDAASAWI